jgi:hypothetical protein
MPRQPRPPQRRPPQQRKPLPVEVIVAIVSTIGVVLAALIGIMPTILRNEASATPVVLSTAPAIATASVPVNTTVVSTLMPSNVSTAGASLTTALGSTSSIPPPSPITPTIYNPYVIPTTYRTINGGSATDGANIISYRDDTYAVGGAPHISRNTDYNYLSGGLGKLTDGIVGAEIWRDRISETVGWQAPHEPVIVFDFESIIQFESVELRLFNSAENVVNQAGITLPKSIVLEFSTDGEHFGNPVTYTLTSSEKSVTSAQWIVISTPVAARSIRVTLRHVGADDWIFVSEVRFRSGKVSP